MLLADVRSSFCSCTKRTQTESGCTRRCGRPSPVETTEQHFTELKQNELSGIDVDLESCQGVPAVEIVHRARDTEADLIVIGTHDTLGSVAQNVTRQAHCPVLTVPTKNSDKHG